LRCAAHKIVVQSCLRLDVFHAARELKGSPDAVIVHLLQLYGASHVMYLHCALVARQSYRGFTAASPGEEPCEQKAAYMQARPLNALLDLLCRQGSARAYAS
jgi:hypothetical protein